jgi:hypothetical protein
MSSLSGKVEINRDGIKHIHIGLIYETEPCYVNVSVTYTDGRYEKLHLYGPDFWKRFGDKLTGRRREYFKHYDEWYERFERRKRKKAKKEKLREEKEKMKNASYEDKLERRRLATEGLGRKLWRKIRGIF